MGVTEDARVKAQAALSDAQAQVAELEAQLAAAKAKSSLTDASGKAVDKLTKAPIVRESTEFLRSRTDASSASAKADVDRIEAELATAKTKEKWAKRTLSAVDSVNQKLNEFLDTDEYNYDDSDVPDTIASASDKLRDND